MVEHVKITPARIRRFRQENGLSQAGLATLIGVSRRTIQHYEEGRTVPKCRAEMLAKIFASGAKEYPCAEAGPGDDAAHLKDKIIALQEDKIRSLEYSNSKLDLILSLVQQIIDRLGPATRREHEDGRQR